MPTRSAHAEWNGAIDSGSGRMQFGGYEGPYSFRSRMQDGEGTNPEELIGAAHAGCFSMALSVVLTTVGKVPGMDEDAFVKAAEAAKENCPVSVALKAVDITLNASLAS